MKELFLIGLNFLQLLVSTSSNYCSSHLLIYIEIHLQGRYSFLEKENTYTLEKDLLTNTLIYHSSFTLIHKDTLAKEVENRKQTQ